MNKIFLILFCLIIVSPANLVFAEEKFTGYDWEELSHKSKLVMVSAYIHGYFLGKDLGLEKGREIVISELENLHKSGLKGLTKSEIEDIPKEKLKELEDTEIFQARAKLRTFEIKILASILRVPEYNLQESEFSYYVKEVDKFLETFPLCKGEWFYGVINKLMQVWTNNREMFYEKIGEACMVKEGQT